MLEKKDNLMMTEVDESRGLVKTTWDKVRHRVAKVEPIFAQLVDEIGPDKSFPVFLAYFPYGEIEGDTISPILPRINGGSYRLSDPDVPKEVYKHLGYGATSAPFGMVLDKNFELFIDLKDEKRTIPWLIYSPGDFFPFSRILIKNNSRIYAPNGILTSVSGLRSIFMLPNIGCTKNHSNLQDEFKLKKSAPKSLYDHWDVFKELVNKSNYEWRACMLYFSSKWTDKLQNDKNWIALKLYLHELSWKKYEYQQNRIYYDFVFSIIQKKRGLKPNPYLTDTAKHLFEISIGAAPAYAPQCDDGSLPIELLQKIYVECYGLKKYLPTIMAPVHFNFENAVDSVYYSLQNPSTFVFSPKSRKTLNALVELREMEHIMKRFIEELSKPNSICCDTIMGSIAKKMEFKYFHNERDSQGVITPTNILSSFDNRFDAMHYKHKAIEASFAIDAPFLRGCISIKKQVKSESP